MASTSTSRRLYWILALSLALRAAAVVVLGDREPGPDALDDYLPIAANVVAGEGFINAAGAPDSVRGPGYPLWIAAVQSFTGASAVPAVLWSQAILDTATVAVVYWLALGALGTTAAAWGATLYAVNPLAVYACTLVGPETLFASLLAVSLACLTRASDGGGWRWYALAGLASGVCVLTRATPLLLIPLWGAWLFARARGVERRRAILHAAVLFAAAAAVVVPWTFRNWRVFGEFIPVVANGGVNVYAGSSERFWPPPPEHHRQRELRMQELIAAGAASAPPDAWGGPAAGDAYWLTLARANYLAALKTDPVGLGSYLVRKSLRLWYATQSGRHEVLTGVVNGLWLALAIGGVVVLAANRQLSRVAPCLITIIYFPAVMTALFPLARYVVGFAPCLCIAGAAACAAAHTWLAGLGRKTAPREWRPPVSEAVTA